MFTLNRKLRVHFGYLGRFFEDFGPFQALLRVTFTTIVEFMTDRYPLHEQSVGIVQYYLSHHHFDLTNEFDISRHLDILADEVVSE